MIVRISDSDIFNPVNLILIVFDGKSEPERIISSNDEFMIIHHATLSEIRSKNLLFYDDLQIIQDESWELRILLSKIKEKRSFTIY